MISETLSLVGSMYDAVGPGIFFVLALPVFLVALVALIRAGFRRPRASQQ